MKKTAVSLMFAFMLLVSLCLSASAAEAPPDPIDTTNIVQLDDLTAPEVVQDEAAATTEEAEEFIVVESEAPEADSGNAPYMVGAAIAVLVFIGVAFYCKHHGDKTL